MLVHPTAIIGKDVQLGKDVEIGPYCIIEGRVNLGDRVKLHSHVVINGNVTIGEGSELFPFVSLNRPQDLKFHGEPSETIIGKNTILREYVTVQPGTEGGLMKTEVGDNCLLMASSHVAHDCIVGNNVILANNATLAGHVTVHDFAILGGLSAVHQFVRIGAHAMIGGLTGVKYDVIPFGTVMGEPGRLSGLNIVGMNRRGYEKDQIRTLREAYQMAFNGEGTLVERVDEVDACFGENEPVREIIDFIKTAEKRSICQPKHHHDEMES